MVLGKKNVTSFTSVCWQSIGFHAFTWPKVSTLESSKRVLSNFSSPPTPTSSVIQTWRSFLSLSFLCAHIYIYIYLLCFFYFLFLFLRREFGRPRLRRELQPSLFTRTRAQETALTCFPILPFPNPCRYRPWLYWLNNMLLWMQKMSRTYLGNFFFINRSWSHWQSPQSSISLLQRRKERKIES